jgi:hypothetical protein
MLLRLFTLLFLFALQDNFCVCQISEGDFYPTAQEYKPPEWDHYPLNPQPYPKYGKPPSFLWVPAVTRNVWKIGALSLTRLNTKSLPAMTAGFNIYRSYWQPCPENGVNLLPAFCGWITSDQHLNCSSDGKSTNGWLSCEQNPYSRCPHEAVEKDMQWIKWRLFDLEENPNTLAFSQVKMQFVHGVPVLPYVRMLFVHYLNKLIPP